MKAKVKAVFGVCIAEIDGDGLYVNDNHVCGIEHAHDTLKALAILMAAIEEAGSDE